MTTAEPSATKQPAQTPTAAVQGVDAKGTAEAGSKGSDKKGKVELGTVFVTNLHKDLQEHDVSASFMLPFFFGCLSCSCANYLPFFL